MKNKLVFVAAVVLSVFLAGLNLGVDLQGDGVDAAMLVDQTRIFQQGLDGYTGVSDTYISTQDWGSPDQYTCNYGQNEVLRLERSGRIFAPAGMIWSVVMLSPVFRRTSISRRSGSDSFIGSGLMFGPRRILTFFPSFGGLMTIRSSIRKRFGSLTLG